MGEWLERYRIYIVFALAVVIAAGGVAFWVNRPQAVPIIISTPIPTPIPTPVITPTPSPLRVYVTGAVREPDVYTLPPNSIVKDAIAAAGGATADADLDRINLAMQLTDQAHIYVPCKGEEDPPITPPVARPSPGSSGNAGLVNINSATVEELDTLPGIGPAIAQRIVDYRNDNGPFATIEDLMNVRGIGSTTFAELESRIRVE